MPTFFAREIIVTPRSVEFFTELTYVRNRKRDDREIRAIVLYQLIKADERAFSGLKYYCVHRTAVVINLATRHNGVTTGRVPWFECRR